VRHSYVAEVLGVESHEPLHELRMTSSDEHGGVAAQRLPDQQHRLASDQLDHVVDVLVTRGVDAQVRRLRRYARLQLVPLRAVAG